MLKSCSTTTSGCAATKKVVKETHRFTLEKHSLCKGNTYKCFFTTAGGYYQWAFSFCPHEGTLPLPDSSIIPPSPLRQNQSFALRITLLSTAAEQKQESEEANLGLILGGCRLTMVKMTLIDQSGSGNHRTKTMSGSAFSSGNSDTCFISTQISLGVNIHITRDELVKSSYLKNDSLKMECTLGFVLPYGHETPTMNHLSVGVSTLYSLLDAGKYADIIVDVYGTKFDAYKEILSIYSPIFKSIINYFSKNPVSSRKQIEIGIIDLEPQVFKAMLYFMHTNILLENEDRLVSGYAFGPSLVAKLIAAADAYKISSLKRACESNIWNSISFNRFNQTISLAKRYNASALLHRCYEYAADHFDALTELGSFAYLKKNCPLLFNGLNDYLSKEKRLTKEGPPFTAVGCLYSTKELESFDESPLSS